MLFWIQFLVVTVASVVTDGSWAWFWFIMFVFLALDMHLYDRKMLVQLRELRSMIHDMKTDL